MWFYADELKRANRDSSVSMKVERPIPAEPPIFDRFYVCFDALKTGFVKGCKQIIGVDGCFLKTVVKGELLAAIGRDANNQMFPIAWAVVQVESRDTWSWFLSRLKDDLNITDDLGWSIISDQQKGLVQAVAELFPHAEHRMCARHIYANWGGSHKGPKIQRQFWNIAKSTTEVDFKENMELLHKMSPQAYEDLLERPNLKHWCKAFFNPMVKCDIVDNNLCEAFNGRILEARCKSIYSMLEDIRKLVMERIPTQRANCEKWTKDFGPRIEKKLQENLKLSRYCHVIWNGENGYEIEAWGTKFVVDIKNKSCDCRAWQLSGIPCCHAVCALLHKGVDPSEYVHSFYKKEMFLEAYGKVMEPVRDPKFWDRINMHEPPIPPILKKKKGRPKKLRKKTVLETTIGNDGVEQMSRKGTANTCSLCRQPWHNRRRCNLRANDNTESAPGSVGELIVAREADMSRQIVTANQLEAQARKKLTQKKSEGSKKKGLQKRV
ncbi:uncharacterized protein LOC116208951 [Punica granatum]|uniref:Uncharacterized protein LOC116208951 n=1 Tax=Punica granatum TaxID=22663 RepID=A0A6P8E0U8_PUNGR|nr:uncharacterized protein LOC116208951 [Punica granatum]